MIGDNTDDCSQHSSEEQLRYEHTNLYRDGYSIVRHLVNVTPTLERKALSRLRYAKPIFNDTMARPRGDRLRRQSPITLMSQDVLGFDRLHGMLGVPDDVVRTWVVLQSKAGCQAQAAHADYEVNPETWIQNNPRVSHGCVVSLQDGTKLDVWKGAHLKIGKELNPEELPVPRETLSLSKGDAVVFRADCIHAGAAYDKENLRLHCYLDIPSMPHTKDYTARWQNLLPAGVLDDP